MKTRNGFVSNSSSSSFIVVGKKIDKSEIKSHGHVWLIGSEYGEGTDAFELTPEMQDIIVAHTGEIYATFISAIKTLSGDDEGTLEEEDIKLMSSYGKVDVLAFDKSYYDSLEQGDWEERYLK